MPNDFFRSSSARTIGVLFLLYALLMTVASTLFGASPFVAMFCALETGVIFWAFRRYARQLDARMNNDVVWQVVLNDVPVGNIDDAQYASILKNCLYNPGLYWKQTLNMGRVLLNVVLYGYKAIPIGMFWIAVAMAVLIPDAFAQMMQSFQTLDALGTAALLTQAVSTMASGLVLVGVWYFFSIFLMGTTKNASLFGFQNCFDEAAAKAIRQHCAVPAEGVLELRRDVVMNWSPQHP